MNKLTVFPLMFSSTPPSTPTPTPAADTCLCWSNTQTMVFLCNAHHYNSFCLFPNKMMPISLDLLSEHASFFLIPKVLIVFLVEISKQMRVLCCLWSLGYEETVCLCDSGTKIIPLWNARVGKVVYSPFNILQYELNPGHQNQTYSVFACTLLPYRPENQ